MRTTSSECRLTVLKELAFLEHYLWGTPVNMILLVLRL